MRNLLILIGGVILATIGLALLGNNYSVAGAFALISGLASGATGYARAVKGCVLVNMR